MRLGVYSVVDVHARIIWLVSLPPIQLGSFGHPPRTVSPMTPSGPTLPSLGLSSQDWSIPLSATLPQSSLISYHSSSLIPSLNWSGNQTTTTSVLHVKFLGWLSMKILKSVHICEFLFCMLYPTTVLVWFLVASDLGMRLLQLFEHACKSVFCKKIIPRFQVAQSIVWGAIIKQILTVLYFVWHSCGHNVRMHSLYVSASFPGLPCFLFCILCKLKNKKNWEWG